MRTRIATGRMLLRGLIFGALLIGSANGAESGEKGSSSQFIFIDGEVLLPNRFAWTNGTTLTSIIAQAQGLTDFADRERIEVVTGSRTQVCSYAAALKTQTKNILLSPGDKVYVPRNRLRDTVKDLALRTGIDPALRPSVILQSPPASSVATVRHVKTVRSEGAFANVTFEITNHTADTYTFVPVAVEARPQAVWEPLFAFRYNYGIATPTRFLGPRMSVTYNWDAKDFPTNLTLRLRLDIRKATPVTATTQNLSPPVQIISEEFVEPAANEQGKENSEK